MKTRYLQTQALLSRARGLVLAAGVLAALPLLAQTGLTSGQTRLLDEYCSGCHNLEDFAGGFAMELLDTGNLQADAEIWEKVRLKLKAGMMPPLNQDQPGARQVTAFLMALEQGLDQAWAHEPYAGAPLLHRMNRTEYQNAVRDLLDLPINAAALFPVDSSSEGFDNMASVLSVSPALMQAYVSAAGNISRLAVGDMDATQAITSYSAPPQDQSERLESNALGTRGGLQVTHVFPLDAEYSFSVARTGNNTAFSLDPVGTGDPVELVLDGERIALFPPGGAARITLSVPAGPHVIEAAFVKTASPRGVDDLHRVWSDSTSVSSVTITGPINATGPGDTPSRERIFTCMPSSIAAEESCARSILESLAYRAYRRPVSGESMDTLMRFYREGREQRDFETGIQYGLSRILVDPQFIYRFEQEPQNLPAGETYALDAWEIASRLSFFLWSSIPDDALLAAAASGELLDPQVQAAQITRMLADSRSQALVDNFATAWLELRQLGNVNPVSEDFDGSLRSAMRRETELFLASVLMADRPITELLSADYTFVNERLARHYGIPRVRGSHFRRVSLDGTGRHGLLGHGSVLTITSAPNRTSPVIRGAWIMENLLGTPPPPPPPGVETNLEEKGGPGAAPTTLRQRLELHRADPGCAACHSMMDPIGFALENFDPVGKYRSHADGQPVDAGAVFWDGSAFDGPDELYGLIMARQALFVENFTRKLMTYALGRKVEYQDMPAVRQVVREAESQDYRLSALVAGIVMSDAFSRRSSSAGNLEITGSQ